MDLAQESSTVAELVSQREELAKKNGDQWRCDEFSGQNEACGSRYQEHNGAWLSSCGPNMKTV